MGFKAASQTCRECNNRTKNMSGLCHLHEGGQSRVAQLSDVRADMLRPSLGSHEDTDLDEIAPADLNEPDWYLGSTTSLYSNPSDAIHISYDEEEDHDDLNWDNSPYLRKVNPRIDHVDTAKLLASVFRVDEEDVPEDLIDYADEDVDLAGNLTVDSHPDYYEDSVSVTVNDSAQSDLISYADRYHRLHDSMGITHYAQEHGVDIRGKGLNALVKESLTRENGGRVSSLVEGTSSATTERVRLDSITVDSEGYMDRIDSDDRRGDSSFAGVVVKKGNRYHLVDGHHRTKQLMQDGRRKSSTYIVLE